MVKISLTPIIDVVFILLIFFMLATNFQSFNKTDIKNAEINFEKSDLDILNKYEENLDIIRDKIDKQDVNFYINFIINSLFEANKYFNDQEPWQKKHDLLRLNTIIYTTLEIIRKNSYLLFLVITDYSWKEVKIFDLTEKDINFDSIKKNEFLIKGNDINKIGILFKKIEKNNDWFTLSFRSWTVI